MSTLAQVGAFLHGLISEHPFIYTLIVVPIMLYLIRKLEAAIPAIANWADARQEAALKCAGLSEEEIALLEEHEAKDMRVAADALDKRAAARRAAVKPPTTP